MKIPLTTGAYESRSIIAEAQRSINLYAEHNPQDAESPVTQYPTPGIDLLLVGTGSPARCTYRASNGDLYMVIGGSVYYINSSLLRTLIGTITYGTAPVYMADNGLAIVLVDGSNQGWAIDLATRAFAAIPVGVPFYGSNRVDYLDTFFLLDVPNTNQWYISLSESTFQMLTSVYGSVEDGTTVGGSGYTNGTYTNNGLLGGSGAGAIATIIVSGGIVTSVTITSSGSGYVIGDSLTATGIGAGTNFAFQVTKIGGAFDPLDIATKNGYPDPVVGLITMHREIWLIGTLTTEVWYDAGAADFAFQAMPGAFIEHGSNAVNSICAQDLSVYWLSSDKQGRSIFMRGAAYQALRISTHAVEDEWMKYPTTTDCVAYTYQQDGHTFLVANFPSGNATWVYDQATELWHQRAWTDNQGVLNRHRSQCFANAYGMSLIGDWQNGNLYQFNLNTFVDNIDGNGLNPNGSYPMSFIRSFPHIVEDGKRMSYNRFSADFQSGTDSGSIDGSTSASPPTVSLRWSDDRGASYGNKVEQSMGAAGQYLVQPQWRRNGIARDRIYEISWSTPTLTALNGCWLDITPAGT